MRSEECLTLKDGEYELGFIESDGMFDEYRPFEMLCYVTADGGTPADFFGYAYVTATSESGKHEKEWQVGDKRCPFRKEAVAILVEEWTKRFGAITPTEVERAIHAHTVRPAQTFETYSDQKGSEK